MTPQHPADLLDQDFLSAIADPIRLRILTTLERSPATTGDLAAATDAPVAEVTDHLQILADRRLVVRDGDRWAVASAGWIRLATLLRDADAGA